MPLEALGIRKSKIPFCCSWLAMMVPVLGNREFVLALSPKAGQMLAQVCFQGLDVELMLG